jgi:hypothetical protein
MYGGGMSTARTEQAAEYNPCDNMVAKVATDTAAGAIAGALINSTNRGQGAGIGAGAGLAGSYAIRNAQCESYKQQQYYREQALRQQAAAMAQQNAPRCQYYEQNGVQYRSCTETVQGQWRR